MPATKTAGDNRVRYYRVVAPYVLLRQPSPGGFSIAGLHEGATVDGDAVPDYQLAHHVDNGMIVPIVGAVGDIAQADPTLWAKPSASAPHQVWVEYARAAGLDASVVAGMSRDDLAVMFGALDAEGMEAGANANVAPADPVDELPAGPVPLRPDDGDSKTVWVDYAVARGAAREDAQHSTRAELISQYGG